MRETILHRPLALAASGLVLGVIAVNNLFAAITLLFLLVFLRNLRASLVCACAFAIGAVIAPRIELAMFPKQFINTDATVVSVPKLYTTETVAEIRTGNAHLMMSGPPDLHVAIGQRIHIKGNVKPLAEGSSRLADRGIQGRIWVDRLTVLEQSPWIYRVGQGWRDSFVAFVDQTLPARTASAVEAVCFNVQSRLDETDREAFSRAGTVHAIAASGLHVGILVLVLLGLMSLFPIQRVLQLSIVGAVLVLYAIASGLNPPVIRAASMAILVSSAYLARREPDLLSAISLAAIVQLLWDPTALYDAGFQLSFVVLTAVAFFGWREKRAPKSLGPQVAHKLKHHLGRTALITLSAAPLAAYEFGSVSLTSIGANAVTVVVLPPLVVGAMFAHLISFVSSAIATGIMLAVVQPLSGWLLFVTDHLGGGWAAITIPAFSGYWLLLIYGLMLIGWRVRLRSA